MFTNIAYKFECLCRGSRFNFPKRGFVLLSVIQCSDIEMTHQDLTYNLFPYMVKAFPSFVDL